MGEWGILIGVIGALGGITTVIVGVYRARRETVTADVAIKAQIDQRIDVRIEKELERMYEEFDKQTSLFKRQMGAATRIIRALSRQWPDKTVIPILERADIDELENTIPAEWIRDTQPKGNPAP